MARAPDKHVNITDAGGRVAVDADYSAYTKYKNTG